MPVIALSKNQTEVFVPLEMRTKAISAAHRMCMSPHEWTFTQAEQEAMAQYVLWATQRIDAYRQLSTEAQLRHEG